MIRLSSKSRSEKDPAPQRILLMTTFYGMRDESPNLINDMASALAADGHVVQVVVLKWDAKPGSPTIFYKQSDGVDVICASPRQINGAGKFLTLASKWTLTSLFAMRAVHQKLAKTDFDIIIAFSPAVTLMAPLVWALRRFSNAFSYFYIADFFPFHHRDIGLIGKNAPFAIAHFLENSLIRKFGTIGCMSLANAYYLRKNYNLRPSQKVSVLHLWGNVKRSAKGDRVRTRKVFGLPADRPVALFGGQITEGRGIEEILKAAELAHDEYPNLVFLLIGSGRLVPLVNMYISKGLGNLILLDKISRDDYISLATACDVGLVVTVTGVNVPTFPSKTIDYLRAGLPVVASTETATDYGSFIEKHAFGIAVEVGSPGRLLSAIVSVVDDPMRARAMNEAGQRALDEIFDARVAARTLVAQATSLHTKD